MSKFLKIHCDTCGKLIEKVEDAYIEFDRVDIDTPDGMRSVYRDFKVVHKYPITQGRCYKYDSSVELSHAIGPVGVPYLLSFLPELEQTKEVLEVWQRFFLRLQVEGYEDAQPYLDGVGIYKGNWYTAINGDDYDFSDLNTLVKDMQEDY